MKLSARDARAWISRPDITAPAALIYGEDSIAVAEARRKTLAALLGPEAEAEMRLARLPAADLRKDPTLLDSALRSQGFFPGPRAAAVLDATDGLAPVIKSALQAWRPGDAQMLVTAGILAARSTLRKVFEAHPAAVAIALYSDPPSGDEVLARLAEAGLRDVALDGREALVALGRTLDPGDLRQTLDKIALYKLDDPTPLTADEVAACSPQIVEADLDMLIDIVVEGEATRVGLLMQRLAVQGVAPVTICLTATRHFRRLHAVASDSGGASAAVARLKPPVWGPRRDALIRQVGSWGRDRLEAGLSLLVDTDLQLRSSDRAPAMALMERHLIRLAMMGRSRR